MALKDGCQCKECRNLPQGQGHWSDCNVHNEPAEPNGPCDCDICTEEKSMELRKKNGW